MFVLLIPSYFVNEDKLGCARGVIWAVVLQTALIVIIAIFWNLRFSLALVSGSSAR